MNRSLLRIAAVAATAALVGGCASTTSASAGASAPTQRWAPITDNDSSSTNPNTGGDGWRGGDSGRGQAGRY